ncbi:hypothetical protein ES707_00252 [subsurface metagenome]
MVSYLLNICYYFLSFSWGIFLLLSFIGLGSLLSRFLFPQKEVDWGQRAAWGVALTIFLGGILNLFGAISRTTVLFLIEIGFFSFFFFDSRRLKDYLLKLPKSVIRLWHEDKIAVLGIFLVLILLLARYAAWVNVPFNFHTDDVHGYLVFPQKMLQTGSLGKEPFSERRIFALGGHSFLHVLVFCFLQIQNLYIIEGGLAYIIMAGLLWGFAKEKNIPRTTTLMTLIIFLLLINPPHLSSTSHGMALAIFLALFRVFGREETIQRHQRVGYVFIGALLVSALCASKTNFAVFCAIYLGITYCARFLYYHTKKDIVLELLILSVFVFLLLLPWMVSSYQSSGTMWYPLLGNGYHRSAYGYVDFPLPTLGHSLKAIYSALSRGSVIFLITLCLVSLRNSCRKDALQSVCITISGVVGIIVMGVFFGNRPRYTFPFFFACLTCAVLYVFSDEALLQKRILRRASFILVALFILWLLADPLGRRVAPNLRKVFPHYCRKIYTGIRQGKEVPQYYKNQMAAYRKAQYAVPAREIILTRLRSPFLLDFKRNRIFFVDMLILGPSPGMPVFRGGDAVANYLISQGIRYIMYSYGDEGVRERGAFLHHLKHTPDTWVKQQALFTLRFHDDLDEMGVTRKRIYDNGQIFVIDLYAKVSDMNSW